VIDWPHGGAHLDTHRRRREQPIGRLCRATVSSNSDVACPYCPTARLYRRVDEQICRILGLAEGTVQRNTLLEEFRGARLIVLVGGYPGRCIHRA